MTKRVAVTGGSGKLGSACIEALLEDGWTVHNFDLAPPAQLSCSYTRIDFGDYGQVVEAFAGIDQLHDGVDAVVHLAAIPGPTHAGNVATFDNNITATFHVFQAARHLGVTDVVWASSETLLGYPFDLPPEYVPLDEQIVRRPAVAYSLAKDLEEEMAAQFCRWDPALKMIGLRFSNVMTEADYAGFPSFEDAPASRKWNLWSYIDARDGAAAVVKALAYEPRGFDFFNIANDDSVMRSPSSDLLDEYFPGTERRADITGTASLMSSEKAKRVLGYRPEHSWRTSGTVSS